MKTITIGHDYYLKKEVKKIAYLPNEIPKLQLFNANDVIVGNPSSNIALAFVYNWKTDNAPKEYRDFLVILSNYCAISGYWKTTNGAKYVFANILSNPNINKLILVVFDGKDNGHLIVDAVRNFWQNGVDENGIIRNSKAPNPRFEQLSLEELRRLKRQCDLIIIKNADFDNTKSVVHACIQEPNNAKKTASFGIDIEFYSEVLNNNLIYDDGARFEDQCYVNLAKSAQSVKFEEKNLLATIGQKVQANNLEDAIKNIAAFVFSHGGVLEDQRGIITIECRTFIVTVLNALEKIPDGFSKDYILKYVEEFMYGKGEKLDEFVYTYHDRIFKKFGNQPEKIVQLLKDNPNTRRALISLWDPNYDLGNDNAPCLDLIWVVVRGNELEFHVVYRSHHLATITEDGKLMKGEGAFVPNLYAVATLQEDMAKKLNLKRGPLVLTDFSGHLYVSKVK